MMKIPLPASFWGYTGSMHDMFRRFSHAASEKLGTPWAFTIAVSVIVIWAISGPFLNFSTTWQLFINTITTVLTFLMVFLIQNTQNRDARAIHLKLDELIRAVRPARNMLIDIEDMEEEELKLLQDEFKKFRETKIAEIKRSRTTL
jgi:low affinity Fe/Cu permease